MIAKEPLPFSTMWPDVFLSAKVGLPKPMGAERVVIPASTLRVTTFVPDVIVRVPAPGERAAAKTASSTMSDPRGGPMLSAHLLLFGCGRYQYTIPGVCDRQSERQHPLPQQLWATTAEMQSTRPT